MKKKTTLLIFFLGVLFTLCDTQAMAQSREPRAEVGGQFSLIHFDDLSTTNYGFGGWVSYDLTHYFALDAAVNFFPEDKKELFTSGRKANALFGVKAGLKSDRAAFYGKFRAGFMHFGRNFDTTSEGFNDFAMDVGGVLELFPSRHSVVRFDLGDTIVRFGERDIFVPGVGVVDVGHFTSHNLGFSAGVGYRF